MSFQWQGPVLEDWGREQTWHRAPSQPPEAGAAASLGPRYWPRTWPPDRDPTLRPSGGCRRRSRRSRQTGGQTLKETRFYTTGGKHEIYKEGEGQRGHAIWLHLHKQTGNVMNWKLLQTCAWFWQTLRPKVGRSHWTNYLRGPVIKHKQYLQWASGYKYFHHLHILLIQCLIQVLKGICKWLLQPSKKKLWQVPTNWSTNQKTKLVNLK